MDDSPTRSAGERVQRFKWSEELDTRLRTEYASRLPRTREEWSTIQESLGCHSVKQCRERYENYADPTINHEPFTFNESQLILSHFFRIGSNWSTIKLELKNRTSNAIKNHFNTNLKARYLEICVNRGIKPRETGSTERLAEEDLARLGGNVIPPTYSKPRGSKASRYQEKHDREEEGEREGKSASSPSRKRSRRSRERDEVEPTTHAPQTSAPSLFTLVNGYIFLPPPTTDNRRQGSQRPQLFGGHPKPSFQRAKWRL